MTATTKTTHLLKQTSFDKALAAILEIEPCFTSAVKPRKGDKFDAVLYDEEGKVTGQWIKNSRLSVELGWAKTGSRLVVIHHPA